MRYLHDVAGNVRETIVDYQDGSTHTVVTDYDPIFNYKLATTDPAFGTSISRYNGFGEVYEVEDAERNVTSTTFDEMGRVIARKISSSTATESFTTVSYTHLTLPTILLV